jgi:hypothetical protein
MFSMTAGATIPAKAVGDSSATSENLLRGNQATFGGTTGGWAPGSAVLSWAASPAIVTGGSLAVTATTSQAESAWSGLPASGGLTPATPGRLYTASASVLSGGPVLTLADTVVFYNASKAVITDVWGQAATAQSSTWTALPTVAGIAPPSTVWVVLGVVGYTSSVGQKFFVDSPFLGEIADNGGTTVKGPLHTSGNQILDSTGRPVTLRGVVLNGLQSSASPSGLTEQEVLQAKAWGANFIRVPLGEQFWLSSNCDYSPTYAATVDEVVNWITSLGMVALLDLHYNTIVGCQVGGPHNMADEAQAPTFWSQVAARYAGNPLVAFDLYNEPHDISDSVWLNGGLTIDTNTLMPYEAAGMQQLYNVVRSTGAQNLVFVSGNDWANTVPSALVQGENIVYAAHVYTCPLVAPPACINPDPDDPSQILDNWVVLSANLPVMITEFGWPSAFDGTYNANVISFANAHGWGWTAFAWQPANDNPWSLVVQSPASGPFEPTPAGIPVLLGLAGAG